MGLQFLAIVYDGVWECRFTLAMIYDGMWGCRCTWQSAMRCRVRSHGALVGGLFVVLGGFIIYIYEYWGFVSGGEAFWPELILECFGLDFGFPFQEQSLII